jgi:hypothetical protein
MRRMGRMLGQLQKTTAEQIDAEERGGSAEGAEASRARGGLDANQKKTLGLRLESGAP